MDEFYEMSMLLDFYGQMLTPRQLEIMDLHFNNDYSLGEIAEQLNISRQGVHENIKRGKSILTELEEKLGLVKKFAPQKLKAEEVIEILSKIDLEKLDEDTRLKLNAIENNIRDIVNSMI